MPSDPDPSDTNRPPTRRRSLFSFNLGLGGRAQGGVVSAAEAARDDQPGMPQTGSHALQLRIREFETLRVGDVMVPRAEVAAVEAGTGFADLIAAFAENAVSRLPLYRETLDDPVGFIHIKDLVSEIAAGRNDPDDKPGERLRRELLYVPPSMRCADLLVKMQARRMHIALVVDEYGGTDGLVTLEDLVELIVGDISDEHDDEDAPDLIARGRGVWDADARAEISEFARQSGVDLSLEDYEDEIDTLGGLVYALAGRVPQRGEIIAHPTGAAIEVMEADGRRIKRLRLRMHQAVGADIRPASAGGASSDAKADMAQGEAAIGHGQASKGSSETP
jgi:CBS domain containing-hemolysin-like protein